MLQSIRNDIPKPTAELVLWHEGYKGLLSDIFNDSEWGKYTDSIINFATAKGFSTAAISVIFDKGEATLPAPSLTYINQFISKAEQKGLQAGIEFSYKKDKTTPANVASYLSGITNTKPLLLGIDSEDNGITAAKALEVADSFRTELDNQGINYSDFAILGSMAPKDGWDGVILNGYEYYSKSDDGKLNSLFSDNVNKPHATITGFEELTTQGVENPNNIPGPISAPVFAISRSDDCCLGGELAPKDKSNPCGITDIFGRWDYDKFEDFLGLYTQQYPNTDQIFIYQGDQLPLDWLVSGGDIST